MDPIRYRKIKEIFVAASAISDPALREAFVRRECGQDEALRREVLDLLSTPTQGDEPVDNPILNWWRDGGPGGQPPFGYLGGCRILGLIDEGGMGKVYKGYDERLGRPVAIKVIRGVACEQDLRRFSDEQKILARLHYPQPHPHVVQIYQSGVTPGGQPFFVMEYVEGQDLRKRINRRPLPLAEVAAITRQVADALSHAHRLGVIHRDIKPSNILLTGADGALAKVLDFGIAVLKQSDDEAARQLTSQVIGTPAYLSPEQAAGKNRREIDFHTDIYSLGVVVYEMLTGRLPFTGRPDEIVAQHRSAASPLPSAFNRRLKLWPLLDRAVLKALRKNPPERYQSAEEFAAALQQAVSPRHYALKFLLPTAAALLIGGGLMAAWPFKAADVDLPTAEPAAITRRAEAPPRVTGESGRGETLPASKPSVSALSGPSASASASPTQVKPPAPAASQGGPAQPQDRERRPPQPIRAAEQPVRFDALPAPLSPPPTAGLRLELLVRDRQGRPLQGAKFALIRPEFSSVPSPITSANTLEILTTGVGGSDLGRQAQIRPGEYWIKVTCVGYRSLTRRVRLAEDPRRPGLVRLLVALDPEEPLSEAREMIR
jgi:serine/threonine protein kinase